MDDKREFPRHKCNMPVNFKYFEGDPDEVETEIETLAPIKGKGVIMDVSKGGVYIVSNSRVNINAPITLNYSGQNDVYDMEGIIVRTGLIENNPSEIARKWSKQNVKGDAYIAIKFNTPLDYMPD